MSIPANDLRSVAIIALSGENALYKIGSATLTLRFSLFLTFYTFL